MQNEMVTEKIALLAGFSEANGIEHFLVTEESVNQETMIKWFSKLKVDAE